MTISFNSIPATNNVPFVTAEFDNSLASRGPALLAWKGLLVGQKTNCGSATADSIVRLRSDADAARLTGIGSQLHRMAIKWFQVNKSTELFMGVLADAVASALATGTLVVSGTATADGTLALYLGGERVPVSVTSGDSATTIATKIAAAIGVHASGTIICAAALAADTVTVGGVVFTAASGAVVPGAATFSIDTGNTETATSLASQVNAHTTANQVVRAFNSTATVTFRAHLGGTVPNAYALASSNNTRLAKSAAFLAGGGTDTVLPVYASATSATATVYARNAGAAANEFNMKVNYQDGDAYPAGITVAITQLSGGTSAPTLTTLIANMADTWYNVIAHPYTDATSLSAWEVELVSRGGPMRMIDGMAITAKNDSYAAVATLGLTRNIQYSSIVRLGGDSCPTPPCEAAAQISAQVAYYGAIDPARPFQTLPLPGVKAPIDTDRDINTESSTLAGNGISVLNVASNGAVTISRMVTSYQTNAAGIADPSYRSMEGVLNLSYLRYSWRARMSSKYPRHKLADDGNQIGAGQAVMTPSLGKSECLMWFRAMMKLGLVENFAQFKRDLIVERNTSDVNRMDYLLPADLINQLIVQAAKFQFLS